MRGEELKIHISQNSRKIRLTMSILIVKLSNDVSFPGNYANTKYIKPRTGG